MTPDIRIFDDHTVLQWRWGTCNYGGCRSYECHGWFEPTPLWFWEA